MVKHEMLMTCIFVFALVDLSELSRVLNFLIPNIRGVSGVNHNFFSLEWLF